MSSSPTPPQPGEVVAPPPGDDHGPEPRGPAERAGINLARLGVSLAIPIVSLAAIWFTFRWLQETEASRIVVVVVAVVIGVAGVFALYYGLDRLTNELPERWSERVRPWVFVGPALVLLAVFLIYPAVNTTVLSFKGPRGDTWVGLENYRFVFTDESMIRSMRNTLAWIIIVPGVSVLVGLAVAVLSDKLTRGENVTKSLIFLPMAVSFVGASVVFGLIYDFRLFGNQTGLLNGIWTALGNDPVGWLALNPWNNLFLMIIMIWMQTGFAMVILSAAIKAVPDDILEAGRIDGATEWQIFRRIIVPSIMSSIVVVTTTMVINVLKVFDIVWVMTNGESGTEIIAERMMRWFFRNDHDGRGAAIAVVLFLAVVPVMMVNVRRFRAEEEIR